MTRERDRRPSNADQMAPTAESAGQNDDGDEDQSGQDRTAATEAAHKAKMSRKRTKTGCLTCRKRRIKCGEERPVCKNCTKSKRHCEGYNQRVVFKPPTFDYQPVANGAAHITFQAGPVLTSARAPQPPLPPPPQHLLQHQYHYHQQQQQPVPLPPPQQHAYHELYGAALDSSTYAPIRPREVVTVFDQRTQQYVTIPQTPLPPSQQQQQPVPPSSALHTPAHQLPPEHNPFLQHDASAGASHHSPLFQHHSSVQHHPSASSQGSSAYSFSPIVGSLDRYRESIQPPSSGHGFPTAQVPADYAREGYDLPAFRAQHYPEYREGSQLQPHPPSEEWTPGRPAHGAEHAHVSAPEGSRHSSREFTLSQTPTLATQHQWTPSSCDPRSQVSRPVEQYFYPTPDAPPATSLHSAGQQTPISQTNHQSPEYFNHHQQHVTPTTMLTAAAMETLDDDYWDVGSVDEEMEFGAQTGEQASQDQPHALSRILALNRIDSHNLQMRRYDTFLYNGVLDRYRVEEVASPLKNPATARVFAHFISVTGPTLSIFERHPRSSSLIFAEGSVPLSQQGLWTYTMPMAALRNQGLLHAMLAIASLHIARLQNASVTPSMQHYAWALKHIHTSVANHKKSRLRVTTIAASLLLGFYEIMTADHMKWNMHLAGSKQLFVETNFVKMTRDFQTMKAERATRFQPTPGARLSSEEPLSNDALLDQIPDLDENLISHLTGREVRYNNHGYVETPSGPPPKLPKLDLNRFEILKDLYWWYCKQDVYQSIVSGNALLMDFSRWADCPPRAPLGRIDAVYGTFDHLLLLLGRIADFAFRDRKRKLKQIEANGGQWMPAPGMNMPGPPPQQQPPATPVSAGGNPNMTQFGAMPMPSAGPNSQDGAQLFFGMAPPPRANIQMPSSYNPFYEIPMAQPSSPIDMDLSVALSSALSEYGQIRSALHRFSTSLGEAFAPLTSEYQPTLNTSFGTARFYRSYDISCMWAVYNMAEIIAIRSHPHMPPAAHHAAGIAAKQTAPFANEIGRIAAGIAPTPPDQPLNPTLGAALCESCMPSFFAAIQYTSPAQRSETVQRIFSIAKRTGWGSAELIANGVETAWVKAAAAGRGPPYERIARPAEYVEDPRLNGSWENLDPEGTPGEHADEGDRRFIGMRREARLNWAIGVMGVEEDLRKIKITE